MHSPEHLRGVIKKSEDNFRDNVIEKLLLYVDERIEIARSRDSELAELLTELYDLTCEKQEKRKQFKENPDLGENIIQSVQDKIIILSKKMEQEYPEEFQKIQNKNSVLKLAN